MDNYNLPVGVDIQKLIDDLRSGIDLLSQTNLAARETTQTLREGFTQATEAVTNSNKVVTQSAGVYNAARNSAAQLTDALLYYKTQAFTEQDVNKLKVYNQEIVKIQAQITRLGTIGLKTYSDQRGIIERMTTAIKLYGDFVKTATNTDQIAKYNKKLEETQAALTKLGNAGKNGFDNIGNAIKKADEDNNKFISGIKAAGAALLAAFGVRELINFGKEARELAAKGEGIREAFQKLDNGKTLDLLRKATRGATSDIDLMAAALRAKNFQIAPELLAKGLELAGKVARQTGQDVTYLTDSFVNGLGRKSLLILDNLQISQVQLRNEVAKTGNFQEAVYNVVTKKLAQIGDVSITTADKMGQLQAKIANIKELVGQKINFVLNYDSLRDANKEFYENGLQVRALQKNIEPLLVRYDELNNKMFAAGGITKVSKKEQSEFKDIIKQVAEAVPSATLAINAYGEATSISTSRARDFIKQQVLVLQALNENRIKETQERLVQLNRDFKASQSLYDQLINTGNVKVYESGSAGTGSGFTNIRNATRKEQLEIIKRYKDLKLTIDQQEALLASDSGKLLEDRQKLYDESNKKVIDIDVKAENKRIKAEESAAEKRKRRREKVASEELRLTNQLTQALGEASDDRIKVEIDKENARYQVAKDTLSKQRTDFPELQKLIDKALEAERIAHVARLALIDKKQQEERSKIILDGQKAISDVLKKDDDEQINNVNERYKLIRDQAKKANLLTTEVEKKLVVQQEKDVSEVRLKTQTDNYKKAEDIAIANITARQKRVGETDKEFELENQKAILGIKIQFAEAGLKLIQSNPEKSLEVAAIRANIATLKKELKGVTTDLEKEGGFSFDKLAKNAFGLSDDGLSDLKKGAQGIIDLFNNVSDSILASYQKEIDAGQERIDALKDQLDTAQSYFDDQNKLKNEGYANDADAAAKNVDAIKATLAQEEQARQENIKQQQEAQKVVAAIRAAEIAANTIEQVSNLATAASKIFKAHAGIPFVGVLIALGAVAALIAGFVAIKSSIKAASTEVKKKGGKVLGRSHDEGGNKYQSIDNNDPHIVEIERDEFVINKTSTAKHEKLINAINKDDFSGLRLSDYPLTDLLKGTGVTQNSEVARLIALNTIANQEKSKPAPIIVAMANQDPYTHSMAKNLAKLVKFEEDKEIITDKGDHIEKRKGNTITREWKKN